MARASYGRARQWHGQWPVRQSGRATGPQTQCHNSVTVDNRQALHPIHAHCVKTTTSVHRPLLTFTNHSDALQSSQALQAP